MKPEKEMFPNKVTPALIIGLGGTGQWVLTNLKKNLIESYGEVPRQVQLLAFDTTTDEPEVAKDNLSLEAVRIGDFRLKKREEFIYLSGSVKELCLKAKANSFGYGHITSWFPVNRYLAELTDDDFNLARGAGTRRPFGRMAIFYNLQDIVGKLEFALREIKGSIAEKSTVEICVVSSLAGGTGSGMFIDLAHLSRVIARRIGLPEIAVRGFFMLHNAFQTVAESRSTRLNTYAALLELERFMVLFGHNYPIDYTSANNTVWQTVSSSKLFDSCFLVDAERNRHTLSHLPPHETLYPAIADCITTLLDPVSGDSYQQHYKNVNNRVATTQKLKQMAMYSSFGTQTYILPIVNIVREFELRFAIEFLDRHFAPASAEPETGSMASLLYPESTAGQGALSFLKQNLSPGGLHNTFFVQGMIMHLERSNNPTYVDQLALSIHEDLLDLLRTSGDEGAMLNFAQRIDQALRHLNLETSVRRSDELEDSAENAARRIPEQIRSIKRNYLGEVEQNGGRDGLLRHALVSSGQFNVEQFQKLLTEKLTQILTTTEYGYSRLGFARAFVDHLNQIFEAVHRLLENVHNKRNQIGQMAFARDEVRVMATQLEKTKNSGIFPMLGRRNAIASQRAYIAAEQELINLQVAEQVINELLNQAKSHLNIIQHVMDELNQWFAIWVTGDPLNNEQGVLSQMKLELARWRQFRQQQEVGSQEPNEVHLRHYLTNPEYEEMLYQQHCQEQYEALLNRFQWTCSGAKAGLEIRLRLDNRQLKRTLDGQATLDNSERLLSAIKPYFLSVKQESVISRLSEMYSPETLANHIWQYTGTFIGFQKAHPAASEVEKRIFVSLNHSQNVDYKKELEKKLRDKGMSSDNVQVIPAYDPHRCVVLSTTDMIGITAVPTIQQVEAEYNRLDAVRRSGLHIFPAEVNAVAYEARLGGPGLQKEEIRHFTARVKSLFEDEEKLRLFVQSLATGVIREEDSPEIRLYKQYVLRIQPQIDQLSEIPLGRSWRRPSLFEAIYNFIYARPLRPPQTKEKIVASVNDRANGQAYATLSQINEAVEVREALIRYGLADLVDEISRYVANSYHELRPNRFALESPVAFLLVRNVRKLHTMNLEQLVQSTIIPWLLEQEKYEELIPRSHYKEIAEGMGRIILKLNTPVDRPARLQRHLQEFSKAINNQLDVNDPEERDLATIFEIMVGDYRRTLASR
ncbi:MAG: hypothetical protein IPM39_19480 [Chloroflexi bacterium]|nr:hypothetical protein [Chloroflexota bacterium]